MRILVTGARGFTGRYLVPCLAERGHEVHGLGRPGEAGGTPAGVTAVHEADLIDFSTLSKVISEVRPEAVVHLAAVSFVRHDDPREIYDSNLVGSRNLLQALTDLPDRPSAILLASSANVYGNRHPGRLSETSEARPVNDYGISKLAMEMVARLFEGVLPIIIARPFNYTGVGQAGHFIIPKIVDHARRRASSIQLGNLDVARDFSDVRSVADIYVRLLECPAAIGGTFNVCSGRHHSLRQVMELVEELSGHSMTIEVNPEFVRQNEVHILYGDNRLLMETTGPLEMPPLSETLRWMIEA